MHTNDTYTEKRKEKKTNFCEKKTVICLVYFERILLNRKDFAKNWKRERKEYEDKSK